VRQKDVPTNQPQAPHRRPAASDYKHVMIDRRSFMKCSAGQAAVVVAGQSAMTSALAAGKSSAKAAGFGELLESDPHDLTFMQWPSRASIYGGKRELEAVRSKIALIAQSIAKFQPVTVLAQPDHADGAARALGSAITVWPIPTDDLWCRDAGPTFVVSRDGRTAVSDLGFNG
jgi:agmatine deiminase